MCLGRVGVWVVYELVSDYTAKSPDLKFPEVGFSGHCIEQAALQLSRVSGPPKGKGQRGKDLSPSPEKA